MTGSNESMSEAERGVGMRLRKAREAQGLTIEDVASRLKMPVRVVQSLEEEDWSRLGAPVFVRGQLRSYSRLLGLVTSTTLEASGLAPIEPTPLVPRSYTPRMTRLFEQGTRRLVYIVLTAAIVVPVWLATKPHLTGRSDPATVQSLDAPVSGAPRRFQSSASRACTTLTGIFRRAETSSTESPAASRAVRKRCPTPRSTPEAYASAPW